MTVTRIMDRICKPALAGSSEGFDLDEFRIAEFVEAVDLHFLCVAIVVENAIVAYIYSCVSGTTLAATDDYISFAQIVCVDLNPSLPK